MASTQENVNVRTELFGASPSSAVVPGKSGGLAAIPRSSAPSEAAYSWRGMMLDSARTCWSVETAHELIELMGRYRLNRLHWHLTDDSGWRFEVPGYERLLEVGAHLPRPDYTWYGNILPSKRDLAASRAGALDFNGHYSAEEIAALVDHAGRSGIEIMPEVDLPGHMGAAIRSYPELGDPRLQDVAPELWDHPNDLLWPSEASFEFISSTLTTVMDQFPFPVVHIGGDECKYWIWETDPALVARFGDARSVSEQTDASTARHAENLLSASGPGSGRSTVGPRLQGLFTDHARQVLAGRSRRLAAWDELLSSPTDGDELIMAWRGEREVPAAEQSGNPWIYADCTRLYLNRVAADPESEPPGMFNPITPRDIIELDVPDSATLHGIQAAVWTEFILDKEHLFYQLFPRLLAVAERAWCGDDVEREEFSVRLESETRWLRAQAILPTDPGQPWSPTPWTGQAEAR